MEENKTGEYKVRELGETKAYPPFTPSVDNTITKNQTASTTHEIPAAKFLNDIRVRISAVWADEANSKVGAKGRLILLGSFDLGLSEWEWLRICH